MIKAVIFDMFETLITHYESPLYFAEHMAADMGISEERFREIWDPSGSDRSIGKLCLEEVVRQILEANDLFSEELFTKIITKRKNTKQDCFRHIHTDIIPLLEELKNQGLKIGLISNCFAEEVEVIQNSILFPYFDAPLLSYKEGIQKPDKRIYYKCMERLGVEPGECIYVGDGGSYELETASELGMLPLQAVWYLKEGSRQRLRRMDGFIQIEKPMDILKYCRTGANSENTDVS